MAAVLVVQNTRIEGSGLLGRLLADDGFDVTSIHAKQEALPQEPDHDFMIVLGAPESANDDCEHLRREQNLIRGYVQKNRPVLGICLGSQLIARAFGGRVYRGPKKEIGFYHDLSAGSTDSGLFAGFQSPFTVFHWHGDTFELPAGATRLAKSQDYANQAFRYKTAVGVQFHLEVDEPMIRLWLERARPQLDEIPYISTDRICSEITQNIPKVTGNLELFYKNFKSEFSL